MSNLTTFHLIRHGQTDWNKKRILQGQKDPDLNETGLKQAKELAQILHDIPFDLAFSSDLLRAKRTAEIIALEKKLHVETTHALRERNFGHLEGGTSDIFLSYLKLVEGLTHEERQKHRMGNGIETDEEMTTRFITFLREVAITHPGKKVLITSHSGVLRLFLIHLGQYSYNEIDSKRMRNGAYIVFQSDGVEFFIKEVIGIEDRNSQHESI